MDSSQLVDSLTAHIALYNSSFAPSTSPPNPRASILRWFSSLTIHQRQSSLTVVDSKFTDILLEMLTKIQKQGGVAHGCFILLPDIPSRHNPSLPTLCFRRSKGLLARVSSSNTSHHSIRDAVRLFGSGDGENIDSITVSEEFVADFDRFVSVMDGVTNGAFLRGEENLLASSWEELPWLKAKGYYSVEAFVANKLELALRLSWLNCNGGGKKRGAKLKEKANIAGVAANVYWRKKGCLDWWAALDPGTRKRIFQTVLAKAAKSLTKEILKLDNSFILGEEWSSVMGEEQQLSYNCTSNFQSTNLSVSVAHANVEFHSSTIPSSQQPVFMSSAFNRLLVLQEVSAMILAFQHSEYKKDKLFFSTLASIHTVCDYILRRVRGLLMIVSSDCIKLDLLTGENVKSILNKSSDKVGGSRKGKAKGRNLQKLNSVPKPSGAKCAAKKPVEDQRCELVCKKTVDMTANGFNDTSLGKDPHKETSLSRVEVEHAKGVLDVKAQIGKNRKGTCSTKLSTTIKEPSTAEDSKIRITKATRPVSFQCGVGKSNQSHSVSAVQNLPNDLPSGTDSLGENICSSNSINKHNPRNDSQLTKNTQVEFADGSTESSGNLRGCNMCSREEISECVLSSKITPPANPIVEADNVTAEEGLKHQNSEQSSDATLQPVCSPVFGVTDSDKEPAVFRPRYGNYDARGPTTCFGSTSYEWPSTTRFNVPFVYSHHLPAATDRLHLDVGRNWRNHFHQSFVSTRHQALNPPVESGHNRLLPQTLMMSLDWPPMVRSASRLTPSITCNYDSGFIPRLQPSFRQGFTHHGIQLNGMTSDEERKYQSDALDSCDLTNAAEVTEDSETHWISEEEFEVHALSGRDYNQYFGGGVMYWNTSDHAGPGFSRPPSLSSEDNSWAWHEADLNRTIDDMVGFPSSYSSNGLTSPPAGSFCSSFDPLGPGHPSRGYVMPGNDVASKVLHSSSTQIDGVPEENVSGSMTNSSGGAVEGKKADSLPYPILRPIIIPSMSRKGSRSEFKLSHDHKSPRVPLIRREQPRIKRPPSPVVLCVPRAPCPLPPSPVGESRKRRGFPTVRSGSSSPRHWGLRSWYHDGTSSEEAGIHVDGAEVIWPLWRNEGISATPMIHPLPAALLHDRLLAISQLALDQEHPDVGLPLQPPDILNCPAHKGSLSLLHRLLHDEIDSFCKQVAAKNLIRKPYINWAVKRFARSLQVLWPRSRTNIFGSNATGLSLPTSDVDLVVCLPPVRNLEPIKEAGILEGRNGIKETCLQHAARYLANQEWVKNDSLKTVENTAIPIIMLVAEVQDDLIISNANTSNMQQTEEVKSTQMNSEDSRSDHFDMVVVGGSSWQKCQEAKTDKFVDIKSVCLDISFKSPSHSGLQTTELVRELTKQFPATTPLALVLKQFLADRSLDHSYSGGLSSYCLVLLITRFLQHEHHLGRPINQNLGSLLMDFLYFFGNVFDPRHMRISIQGSGYYVNRERGQSIDPIHIDDPLFPTNNVGRNCFRIHQCIKAFADAYSVLESELTHVPTDDDQSTRPPYRLLPKIIPSIDHV